MRSRFASRRDFRIVNGSGETALLDHRRYPLCRVLLSCGACGWARGYKPERILDRLRVLRAGTVRTPVQDVARRVQWPCPGCGRLHWSTVLAWPADVSENDIKRMASAYRN
jgi:hypothetical protein